MFTSMMESLCFSKSVSFVKFTLLLFYDLVLCRNHVWF